MFIKFQLWWKYRKCFILSYFDMGFICGFPDQWHIFLLICWLAILMCFGKLICSFCINRCCVFVHRLLQTNLVFSMCMKRVSQPAQQVLRNLELQVPQWIQQTYSWGLDFRKSTLSKGYILLKPTREFAKARPIVDYSTAWARKLGSAISTRLIEILNTVFRSILEFPDVRAVIEGIRRLFTMESFAESAYCLHQTDIAGFYNQAQHSRIFDAIEYVVYTYAQKTEQGLDTVLQAHIHKLERYLRVFQGRWRDKSKQYFSITLRHIPAIVQYLLGNSYFTVGSQVFRQCRGTSMGSQFAPVLCSAVALKRERNYHLSFSPFTWDLGSFVALSTCGQSHSTDFST